LSFSLSTQVVPGAGASRWLVATHGIFGTGGNLRTLANRLVEARPDWGVVLVDLRNHGRSQGAPPPHTVASAAEDVVDLATRLAGEGKPVRALLGHSYGGKVMLTARQSVPELEQTWVLDSGPSARPGALDEPDRAVPSVLRALEALPATFANRDAFVEALGARGIEVDVAQWLAMNLESNGGSARLRMDLVAVREMLADYYSRDLWHYVEDGPGTACVIVAGRSHVFDAEDRERLADLAAGSEGVLGWTIAEAGHWVHVGALEQVVKLLAEHLDR
jgi:pimeloyl-ACP methyl ester carboxylesterase